MGSKYFTIKVKKFLSKPINFFLENLFTSNGDGLNDVFTPFLFGDIKSFRFHVYNRLGPVVFQTNIPGKGWDGNYKGQKQNSNVFVWNCIYQLNGKKWSRGVERLC